MARADRPAQGTSCASRKPYPSPSGATHVMFEPLDFISRLVALIPKPRVNLTRFHGVFAPNSRYRAMVTPSKRGKGRKTKTANDKQDQTPAERHAAMTWAQRLKRVFNIDIETCSECGSNVKIIASIEDPLVIQKILAHLDEKAASVTTGMMPQCRHGFLRLAGRIGPGIQV